ncbi:MAG: DNA-directed RNA polymerase subunit delta [Bacilli bacterium]|nr:DNA-directed RNA polymerase subunit delta [Bacilli bacterium]
MTVKKMKKEELELLSNKDITNLILEESKKPLKTGDLFKKIIKLLDLPEETFENKIGDYFTSLSTDKRFIMLENGCWDLRSRYTSDKVIKAGNSEDDDDIIEMEEPEEGIIDEDEIEDDYSDNDDDYTDDTDDDFKDLVVMDEDELELEQ